MLDVKVSFPLIVPEEIAEAIILKTQQAYYAAKEAPSTPIEIDPEFINDMIEELGVIAIKGMTKCILSLIAKEDPDIDGFVIETAVAPDMLS